MTDLCKVFAPILGLILILISPAIFGLGGGLQQPLIMPLGKIEPDKMKYSLLSIVIGLILIFSFM